jgi:ubiquinone/menaquinone biosynthesis C-methylase UbiE
MEHFLDVDQALREVRRVLKRGGHYVDLVHVRLTFWERFSAKLSKFFSPRPRPARLMRWWMAKLEAGRKAKKPAAIKQPIQNKYTTRSGRGYLERNGFRVIDVIHTRKHPGLPLKGPFVVIYICQK